MTTTATASWQQDLADQVAQIDVKPDTRHLVVHLRDNGDAVLLAQAASEEEGVISAEDWATKVNGGEVSVVPLAQIQPLVTQPPAAIDETETDDIDPADDPAPEPEDEPEPGADEEHVVTPPAAIDGTASGPDADKGKLFDVPRVQIVLDESDPTVLKVAFSGSVELERGDQAQAKFFNQLVAGNVAHLHLVGYVKSGPTKTHRRDSEGNVDAVVAQKSIVITDVRFD